MSRIIAHVDMNSFYAAVEQAENPALRGKPVVVAGKEELRHGIVLTKSTEAKKYNIKTAEALWEARAKCPGLIVLPPNYKLYERYALFARDIYYQYTDLVEPFGLDESWLDLSGALHLHGKNARLVVEEISERMKAELGCSVSIGLSWNKILAKFGSDYQKPDAITYITPKNFKALFWSAPVEDLLYVGPATKRKLNASGYMTIGDLAGASDYFLKHRLGKMGFVLRNFARGIDNTPVKPYDPLSKNVERCIKSYGNGLTSSHDITCPSDAKALLYVLAESVAQRLREDYMRANTISIGVRDGKNLSSYTRQTTLERPCATTSVIAKSAWMLLKTHQIFSEEHPVRGLSLRASGLVPRFATDRQLSLFDGVDLTLERLDYAIDSLRKRYGNTCITRGIEMMDSSLKGTDIKDENTVHPLSYFHT